MSIDHIIAAIQERIATLTHERDDFMQQANLQAAAMAGGIQELESMLAYLIEKHNDGAETPPEPPGE